MSAENSEAVNSLAALFFHSLDELGKFTSIERKEMPAAFQTLLAHDDHMTVTVEAVHNSLVDLEVLKDNLAGELYTREIVLKLQTNGKVVLFGVVRIDFTQLDKNIADEIASKQTPLGRILIRHNVHRRVELQSLYRVSPGSILCEQFKISPEETLYGRTATIHVAGRPAIELLEIVHT